MHSFTITPSIPSGPGLFLFCRFLVTSSTLWFLKFGAAWEAGVSDPDTCVLMFFCCTQLCATGSSGRGRDHCYSVLVTPPDN